MIVGEGSRKGFEEFVKGMYIYIYMRRMELFKLYWDD